MIQYYRAEKDGKIKKTDKYSKGCWVHVTNPDESDLKHLADKFKLEKASLLDGLDIYENPRFEVDDGKIYIYLSVPTYKIQNEYSSSFLIVYSKDNFITVSKTNLEIFDQIFKIPKIKNFSSARNLIRILHLVSRFFEKEVYRIQKETKTNKRDLNKLKNEDITKLISNEDKLNDYISSFSGIIPMYHRILRDKSIKFGEKDQDIVEDLIIDLNETHTLGIQTLKSISNMRNYYSTKLSNDLNRTVTVLTVFTIFLSIPTLIASVYGMNIPLPFQEKSWILPSLGGLTALVLVLILFVIKRKNII